ncbi:cyclic nucleotide-binding domain-containing protein [Thiosulfativibrio zosterae]|uniref:Cyclic nucleotide-binding domain-containing protein n=1 Tax=Thiosulfativibrio zosterae TaxID=2675053 RepID=A0A6F8PQ23_9GAMM|nr:cyclic nucleotide-binding domain-containing protein [Thiosulfativibrio zosterae]BBP44205.1 hypothetical protein THMIRHAT_19510 [Thiosulfativibrio zosterae]
MNEKSTPTLKSFRADEIIFNEGDAGYKVYIIKQGSVNIVAQHGDQAVTLAQLTEGACFGEMAVLSSGPRSATAVSADNTLVYEIDKAQVLKMISELSPLFRAVIASLIKRVRNLNTLVLEKSTQPHPLMATIEILQILKYHANREEDNSHNTTSRGGNMDIEIEIGEADDLVKLTSQLVQNTLAKILGLTQAESLQVLEKLAFLNLIEIEVAHLQKFIVFSPAKLLKDAKPKLKNEIFKYENTISTELEYLDLAELANQLGTDSQRLIESIALGYISEDAILLKRSVVLDDIKKESRVLQRKR